MRIVFLSTRIFILAGMVFLLTGCSKPHSGVPIINPTVNPIPYSVLIYLITPADRTFNAKYYTAVKSCALSLQNWYKLQMNNKTFVLNPVVVDTLTGLHNSTWYNSNNGPSISGDGSIYAYHNTMYEMQQLLGANFNTTNHTYFIFVAADFPDETIPKGFAAEGSGNLTGLMEKNPGKWIGAAGHSLGHAFGLPEVAIENSQGIMSTGYPQYPNCVLQQPEKDSLNGSPFFKIQ